MIFYNIKKDIYQIINVFEQIPVSSLEKLTGIFI